MPNKHKGSTFNSFLKEENVLEEVEAVALKRVISFVIENAIAEKQLTKSDMAKQLNTSRTALNRLLDPTNTSITLNTLIKISRFLGKKLHLAFV